VGGAGVLLKSKQLYCSQNAPFCGLVCRFNINGPCVVANVVVTDIMLCDMALASTPLVVGRTFVGKSCVGVLARGGSPRHWMQYRNVKKKAVLRTHL